MKAFTDYPFTFLGDEPCKEAPIRECVILLHDGNKYVEIVVEGEATEVKAGYLYKKSGRCGDVPAYTISELERLGFIT